MNYLTLEYRTKWDVCQCCDQRLPAEKSSNVREFDFHEENILDWGNWRDFMEDEEEFSEMVQEYVVNTIDFFATSSDEKILIEESEFNKMEEFIKGIVQMNGGN
ncbi:hypothetical protein [Bacillus sp. Marseille-P3800]|uniref:hypothetical protein n=1 Tax=Bacillus sp. Marseille-P3800 TaxID=2014782 RepID=UPI000C081CE1|nr:hypothetical protein [Bacillus sp. Marseille-P3800]